MLGRKSFFAELEAARKKKMHRVTHDEREGELDGEQRQKFVGVTVVGEQHGHSLVAGGDEHREQRPERNFTGGIQVRRHHGKAALRHYAHYRSHCRRGVGKQSAVFRHFAGEPRFDKFY